MYADLVCKGGGVKGIALIGAISYLEDQGYSWKKLAGTSAGAIVASLLAVGYTAKELTDILLNLELKTFINEKSLNSIPLLGPLSNLLIRKGIYSGDPVEKFLNEKFKTKNKTTFRDLYINGESKLKIIAADVTNKKLIILPDDLVKYNINPLDFEIAKAVRMSISIPFFFRPVIINDSVQNNYVVDGGLLSNFPVWIFDTPGVPRWPTFGLNLFDDKVNCPKKRTSFMSYALDVVETSLNTSEDIYYKESDTIRIVNIPTLGIDSVNFDISKDEKLSLFNSVYYSAKSFLNNWCFESYINRYRC